MPSVREMANTTPGMVCGHHHLYSALARGMPAPPRQPTGFGEILEQVWWRLDNALDHDMIRASALLGATEALMSGTTAIVDHHESPNAIEGSLDVIAEACAEVGVRVVCAYGVTDRHGPDGARRGLEENARYLARRRARDGGCPRRLHVLRRHVGGGRRARRRPRGRRAHPRRRGSRGPRRRGPARGVGSRRLVDRPLRPARSPAARHDRPQPEVEHEQWCRLRPAGATEPTRSCSAPTGSVPTCWRSSGWRTWRTVPTT